VPVDHAVLLQQDKSYASRTHSKIIQIDIRGTDALKVCILFLWKTERVLLVFSVKYPDFLNNSFIILEDTKIIIISRYKEVKNLTMKISGFAKIIKYGKVDSHHNLFIIIITFCGLYTGSPEHTFNLSTTLKKTDHIH